MSNSLLTNKFLGLRLTKVGRASRFLKKTGFFKLGFGEVNNRNGFSHLRPVYGKSMESFKNDLGKLSGLGAEGVACIITDLQWKHNSGITNLQWQNRVVLCSEGNF